MNNRDINIIKPSTFTKAVELLVPWFMELYRSLFYLMGLCMISHMINDTPLGQMHKH